MNTRTAEPPALLRLLGLIKMMQRTWGALQANCLALLEKWTRHEIAERNAAARRALEIDEPIERIRGLVEVALRNDPPDLRRQILSALDEVHANTETAAAALRIELPDAAQ